MTDGEGDDAVGQSTQDGLVQAPLEHRQRSRRCLDLGFGDRALLLGRTRSRGSMVGLRVGDVGTLRCQIVLGLVEHLPRCGIAARPILSVASKAPLAGLL